MVTHTSPPSSTRGRWHERVEQYTPDGAVGRLLVGVPSGPLGALFLLWSAGIVVSLGLLWTPLALVLAGVGLGAVLLSVLMLWPVYLSLIGNVESTRAYSKPDATAEVRHDDPLAVVKRQYAAGTISEAEFERRVETLLDAGAESRPTSHRHTRDAVRETN